MMRIVHLADLHLGFRQFSRDVTGSNENRVLAGQEVGKNQREADVEATFRQAVTDIIAVRPDAVLIAGDVFHSFRPSNGTIVFAIAEFQRLLDGLHGSPVVVASGNHDLPRSRDTSTIMGVLKQLGIHVAEWESERFTFPHLNLSVLAVPETGFTRPELVPDSSAAYNVLLLHGEVHGMPRVHGDRGGVEIPVDELHVANWNYVALGHYHVHHMLAPNMGYSGSIDYTSTNPWGEKQDEKRYGVLGKGFVERDLDTGEQTFHPLPPSRDFIDERLGALGLSSADLTAAIVEKLDDMHPDMAIARLTIMDCPRDLWRGVDKKAIAPYSKRALNLQVVPKAPEIVSVGNVRIGRYRRPPLEEQLDALLKNRFTERDDLSLEAISRLGHLYLAQAKGDDLELEAKLEASVEPVAIAS